MSPPRPPKKPYGSPLPPSSASTGYLPPATPPAHPGPRAGERKGPIGDLEHDLSPRGGVASPVGDGGYDSETDDPPTSRYEAEWRDRERQNEPDKRERKMLRKEAVTGWYVGPARYLPMSDYVRGAELQLRQKNPWFLTQPSEQSASYCAAFLHLRRSGHSTLEAVAVLKSPAMQETVESWADLFNHVIPNTLFSSASHAQRYTELFNLLDADACSPMHPRHVALAQQQTSEIVFFQVIGAWPPERVQGRRFDSKPGKDGYSFSSLPHPPGAGSVPPRTFHQALFAGYQPANPSSFQQPGAPGWKVIRTPTPFVLLTIEYHVGARLKTHYVLLDFSDPLHPGIFDPGFGWLEPRQGHSYVSFELCMASLWYHYNLHGQDGTGERLGLRHIRFKPGSRSNMTAQQIFVVRREASPRKKWWQR